MLLVVCRVASDCYDTGEWHMADENWRYDEIAENDATSNRRSGTHCGRTSWRYLCNCKERREKVKLESLCFCWPCLISAVNILEI